MVPECQNCGAPLGLARADDAPPYFTILIVGQQGYTGGINGMVRIAATAWVMMAK